MFAGHQHSQEQENRDRATPPRWLLEHLPKGRILLFVHLDLSQYLGELGARICFGWVRRVMVESL